MRATQLVVLVPVLAFLALLDHLVQVGLQVLDILLVLGPLLLGQDRLGHGQVQGAHDTVVALIVKLAGQAAHGLLHVLVLVQNVVPVQTWNKYGWDE